MSATIRLLAILEASTVTGPAKNLLQFAEFARAPRQGVSVEVHTAVFQRPDASSLFIETARRRAMPVHVIPESGRFDSSVMADLAALVRELTPHIVQSHAVKAHFLVRKTGLHRQVPWVAFHHGYTAPDLRARLYNQLDRWSLRAARQVLTMSEPFRRELIRKGVAPDRIAVVHNAIAPDWGAGSREPSVAAALRARLKIASGGKVILLVGRLSREKDHATLLAAMSKLRQNGAVPQARLVLVGDGPERARIEQEVGALGLAGAVTLTGQVPSAEPYYGIADVAVLSSLSEGSPNALLEAMAVGVPVVATRVGGVPEIVSDGENALLVAPRDIAGMAGALEKVLTNRDLAGDLVREAHRTVQTRHTPEARTQRLIGIYRSVCEGQIG